jgi:hypothetical protein
VPGLLTVSAGHRGWAKAILATMRPRDIAAKSSGLIAAEELARPSRLAISRTHDVLSLRFTSKSATC